MDVFGVLACWLFEAALERRCSVLPRWQWALAEVGQNLIMALTYPWRSFIHYQAFLQHERASLSCNPTTDGPHLGLCQRWDKCKRMLLDELHHHFPLDKYVHRVNHEASSDTVSKPQTESLVCLKCDLSAFQQFFLAVEGGQILDADLT